MPRPPPERSRAIWWFNARLTISSVHSMLRTNASGPEIGLPGRILVGLPPGKDRNRPSGRPKAGRRADFDAFPVAVRPKSNPEGRFPARKHYCVTSNIAEALLRNIEYLGQLQTRGENDDWPRRPMPGGLREAPGGPGKAHGWLWGASRGPPDPSPARVKKPKNPYFLQGPTRRPSHARDHGQGRPTPKSQSKE